MRQGIETIFVSPVFHDTSVIGSQADAEWVCELASAGLDRMELVAGSSRYEVTFETSLNIAQDLPAMAAAKGALQHAASSVAPTAEPIHI